MMKNNNKYAFIGVNESFLYTFNSEEDAIKAAQEAYKDEDEDQLGFDDETDRVPEFVSILKVYDFEVDINLLKGLINDTIIETVRDEYYDFESGIDDGEIMIKKGYNEKLTELVEKYIAPTGITQIGRELYDYDLKNNCKIKRN